MPKRLATAGLTRQEQSLVRSAVALYLSGHGWDYSEDPSRADVVIVGPAINGTLPFGPGAVRVAVTEERGGEAPGRRLRRPVRYRDLLATLRELSSDGSAKESANIAPGRTILDVLRTVQGEGEVRYLDHEAFPPVRVDPASDTYRVFGGKELPVTYFRESASHFHVTSEHRQAGASAWGRPRALVRLCWTAALEAGRGQILPPGHFREVVKLRRWPDFSRLPHEPSHMRLAAYMHRNAADVQTVARQTGHPVDEVSNFVNACREFGLLAMGIAQDEPGAAEEPRGDLGLVSRIRMKLTQLYAQPGGRGRA